MRNRYAILLIVVLGIVSCSQSLYKPSVQDTEQQATLSNGRKLYIKHCSNCHNLHLPSEYTATAWALQLKQMQSKAKITDEERQLIYNYLTFNHNKR